MTKTPSHIPFGLRSVNPYVICTPFDTFTVFLSEVFGAEVIERHLAPNENGDGERVMHAKVQLGDTIIEGSDGRPGTWPAMPGAFHVYVPDCDATFTRAVAAGATVSYEVSDMPYGERSGGVVDPFGNHWFIATARG
ncbi:MAG: VOC family protein [Deltaproteobacteria bacterium]|nr:VOC family protein [Deltaproteobacteria bacterium]